MKTSTRLLFAGLLALGCASPLFAQLNKAFKDLDRGRYEKALEAFEAVPEDDEQYPLALFGLAELYADSNYQDHDPERAWGYYEKFQPAHKNAKPKVRTEWKDEYDLTPERQRALVGNLAHQFASELSGTTSLLYIDNFLTRFPRAKPADKRLAGKRHNELYLSTAQRDMRYAELANLLNRHADSLARRRDTLLCSVEDRALQAFVREFPNQPLEEFFVQIPKHPLKGESAFAQNDFIRSYPGTETTAWLEFLTAHPTSGFAPLVAQRVKGWLARTPDWKQRRAQFSSANWVALARVASGLQAASRCLPEPPTTAEALREYIGTTAGAPEAAQEIKLRSEALLDQRQFKEAAQLLEIAAGYYPADERIQQRLTILRQPAENVQPQRLGAPINSTGDEYLPVLTADGQRLYFCGKNRADNLPGGREDVFYSDLRGGKWQKPVLLKDISAPDKNDALLSVSPDGNRLYLFIEGKVYETDKTVSGWAPPRPVAGGIEGFAWAGQTQPTPDGRALLFEARTYASGDIDIYICFRDEDGRWGKAQRLDAPINTTSNERTPFLHPDGKTLYFSSAGHNTLGGLDVFKSTRLDDSWLRWSDPVNLGYEINTRQDDWGYSVSTDGATAYFAVKGARNEQDIMSIKLPLAARPDVVSNCVLTLLDEAGKPVGAQVIVQELPGGNTVGVFYTDPATGKVFVTLPNGKLYGYYVKKTGFFPESFNVDLRGQTESTTCQQTVTVRPTCSNNTLRNIFFDFGKADLKPESAPELARLAELIRGDNLAVLIAGHTDDVGSPESNLKLSEQRAQAVLDELVRRGCPADRLTAVGYGKTKPIDPANTDEARAKNRRVEISCKQ